MGEQMNINIDKEAYIAELEKVLGFYNEAKMIGDKEQIKFFQGQSKGIILIFKKMELLSDEELQTIVQNVELETPAIFRK